nr:MAG TPA: hypothetical protein [Microviridae sp.]
MTYLFYAKMKVDRERTIKNDSKELSSEFCK